MKKYELLRRLPETVWFAVNQTQTRYDKSLGQLKVNGVAARPDNIEMNGLMEIHETPNERHPGSMWRALFPVNVSHAENAGNALQLQAPQFDSVAITALQLAERGSDFAEYVQNAQAIATWLIGSIVPGVTGKIHPPPNKSELWNEGYKFGLKMLTPGPRGHDHNVQSVMATYYAYVSHPTVSPDDFAHSRGLEHSPQKFLEWEEGLEKSAIDPALILSRFPEDNWATNFFNSAHHVPKLPPLQVDELLSVLTSVIRQPSTGQDPKNSQDAIAVRALSYFPVEKTREYLNTQLAGPYAECAMLALVTAASAQMKDDLLVGNEALNRVVRQTVENWCNQLKETSEPLFNDAEELYRAVVVMKANPNEFRESILALSNVIDSPNIERVSRKRYNLFDRHGLTPRFIAQTVAQLKAGFAETGVD